MRYISKIFIKILKKIINKINLIKYKKEKNNYEYYSKIRTRRNYSLNG